jgi:TPR repeat protein
MGARVATWLAIAVGGTGGALAALVSSGGAPAAPPLTQVSLPLRPLAEIAAQGASSAGVVAVTAANSAAAAAQGEPATASTAAPLPAASDSGRPRPEPPAADLLPLPTTKEKLLRQEMNCDQRKAEACIVAARSYESGSTGLTDLEKAAKYRRIALTAWISQCDRNSALACATLATMYRAGSGVPQSDRNADALFARARELCRFNDTPVCHELPKP